MNILQDILKAGNGGTVSGLAKQFGVGTDQIQGALSQLIPSLTQGVKNNMKTPQGLDGLLGALTSGKHTQYIEDPSRLGQDATREEGNKILGHILGSKEASRNVAAQAAQKTGLSADTLKKMLPVVATMVMGAMGKKSSSMGLTANAAPPSGAAGLLGKFLDADGDGSITDDLLGMAKKLF